MVNENFTKTTKDFTKIRVNILVGSEELGQAFKRFLRYIFDIDKVNILLLGQTIILSQEMLHADFWLIEAFHPFEPNNPEGFRTAYKLAGKTKNLLLFLSTPEGFPKEGNFWCSLIIKNLAEKMKETMHASIPQKEEFEHLAEKWPALMYEPKRHHH